MEDEVKCPALQVKEDYVSLAIPDLPGPSFCPGRKLDYSDRMCSLESSDGYYLIPYDPVFVD